MLYEEIRSKAREEFDRYLDFYRKNHNQLEEQLFPSINYDRFPLKSRNMKNASCINDSYNTARIHFIISNNGISRSSMKVKEPDFVCIEFLFCSLDKKTYRRFFIKNGTTMKIKKGIKYIEKDFYSDRVFRKERYLLTYKENYVFNESYISILSEYKNGYNDWDVINAKLTPLETAICEIKKYINKDTAVVISFSESKNCFSKCLKNYNPTSVEWIKSYP